MKKDLLLGAHTSAAGGAYQALYRGREIGATTIQLFTNNQRQWNSRPIKPEEMDLWKQALDETGLSSIMSHDSYLINLGSSNTEILRKSRQSFREEIERCHALGIPYLNFHPGAATDAPEEECLERICESLLEMAEIAGSGTTRLLLETTAGQGSSVGHRFEHLAFIIEKIKHALPIGVTIDTCHIFAAGYDIRKEHGWRDVLETFDQIIGLKHLYAFHLNDSMKEFNSRVDRHAPLGEGCIGLESFRQLMKIPGVRDLPKYLETPEGPPVWTKEIALLKTFAEEPQ